jgi:hypothetical protein
MKVNPVTPDPAQISRIRQQLHVLGEQQQALVGRLIDADEMIIGSSFEVYKTCSKPNCRCQRGEKHGPFLALTWSIGGKVRHKMVREADQVMVRERTRIYKDFQSARRQLRIVNKGIDALLDKLKASRSKEYV